VSQRERTEQDHAGTPGPEDPASASVTREVGSEGGTPGDVELTIDPGLGVGSEAGETWQPSTKKVDEIHRDDTGKGRRSP
jgi:hypothetical protein